jgi:hypothetical protein
MEKEGFNEEPSCEYRAVAERSMNESSGVLPAVAVLSKYKAEEITISLIPRPQRQVCGAPFPLGLQPQLESRRSNAMDKNSTRRTS